MPGQMVGGHPGDIRDVLSPRQRKSSPPKWRQAGRIVDEPAQTCLGFGRHDHASATGRTADAEWDQLERATSTPFNSIAADAAITGLREGLEQVGPHPFG